MKQTGLLTMIALTALWAWSCAKDVETPPDVPAGKYATPEVAASSVEAMYHTGAPSFYGESSSVEGPVAAIGGYLSGFFENEDGSGAKVCENCRRLNFDGLSGYVDNVWGQAYQAIAQANDAIENIPLTPGLSSEETNRYLGEAYFFRAFNYFYLVKAFGGVPLVTEGALDGSVEKSEPADVYRQIVGDLGRALTYLPDQAFTKNGFRISRPTAYTLLADVYLTMSGYPLREDHYAQAAKLAKQVIGGGKHLLTPNGATPGTSAYNTMRTQNDNLECIYSYKAPSVDKSLTVLTLPAAAKNWGVIQTGTYNGYMPTQVLMGIYDPYDDMRVQEQQFFHSFVKYDHNGRTVIQTFPSMPYWWFDSTALFGTVTGNGGSDEAPVVSAAGKDVIIYRYAEVLLIAAEAIAMSEGVTAQATGYLADVRSRACPMIDREIIVNRLAALDANEFVREVWIERLREFPLEMKIWPDIQRTRKYPVIAPEGEDKATFRDVVGATNSLNIPFEEGHLLLPAPKR